MIKIIGFLLLIIGIALSVSVFVFPDIYESGVTFFPAKSIFSIFWSMVLMILGSKFLNTGYEKMPNQTSVHVSVGRSYWDIMSKIFLFVLLVFILFVGSTFLGY
jgi:hypothetical protein